MPRLPDWGEVPSSEDMAKRAVSNSSDAIYYANKAVTQSTIGLVLAGISVLLTAICVFLLIVT